MKTMPIVRNAVLLLLALVLTTACKKKQDPEPENEVELITTMKLKIYASGGSTALDSIIFTDLDGPGGAAPSFTRSPLNLTASTDYDMRIVLLDETKNPAENITEEVEEEADEHQFFFTPSGTGFTAVATDFDGNGRYIGLESELNTPAATGARTLRVVLKHQPNLKSVASNPVPGGNPALGETDIDVTFNVQIN